MTAQVAAADGRSRASQRTASQQKRVANEDKFASQERALRLAGEHMNKIDKLIAQN